jgi:hypothetical protein
MAAATGVTYKAGRGAIIVGGTCVLNPGSIAAAAREDQTIAVPDAKIGDVVMVSPRDVLLAGLVVSHARVSAAGAISFFLANHSAGAVDQASGTWDWALIRGATGPSHVG